jgi:hypothetical protein
MFRSHLYIHSFIAEYFFYCQSEIRVTQASPEVLPPQMMQAARWHGQKTSIFNNIPIIAAVGNSFCTSL